MKMNFIDFETSIDSFYRFFSKKSMNKNVDNSRSKNQSLNFNNDLAKALKETFRDFYNNFDKLSFFEDESDTSSIIFYVQ